MGHVARASVTYKKMLRSWALTPLLMLLGCLLLASPKAFGAIAVGAATTASPAKYENTFSTSNAAFTVSAKESVIHVLRLIPRQTNYRGGDQ